MKDLNSKQAAIRAGFSKKSAHVTGPQLIAIPIIKKKIEELKNKLFSSIDYSSERVLFEVARMAMVNEHDMLDKNGDLKPMDDLTRDQAATLSLKEIEYCSITGKMKKRKFNRTDKLKANDMLMKYHSLYGGENNAPDDDEDDERYL